VDRTGFRKLLRGVEFLDISQGHGS
jgi:hypothetical protein